MAVDADHIVHVSFGEERAAVTEPRYQHDYGQYLMYDDLGLPAAYEVHFANSRAYADAVLQIGTAEGVSIPDSLLDTGEPVYAFLFLHDGTDDGRTMYIAKIPVIRRPDFEEPQPTQEQTDLITQAIAALNAAVEQTAQDKADTDANAQASLEAAAGAARDALRAEDAADRAEDAAGRAEASAEAAALSAEASAASAQAAYRDAERAEQAANEAGWMEMDIDGNGHLIYARTDAVDVDFFLRLGHLVMEAI